jgi:regulator of PEP synthase PpsR (kinase-PPPase family)
MDGESVHNQRIVAPPIYVVSGGVGASGEQLVRTALAQFSGVHVPVEIVPHVHEPHAIETVVALAQTRGGAIVHTLVDPELRRMLEDLAVQHNIVTIDAMGPLLSYLSQALNQAPLGQPGLYRQLYSGYFKRIAAIEFAVAHDDGKRVEELPLADIVLTGVSRVGKTPLSIFLSMQGWKVANVPLMLELPPPKELLQLERRRVVGLTLQPQQLLLHRRSRQARLGVADGSYVDIKSIVEELRMAHNLFASHAYPMVDMTDKPIETSAEEVVGVISRPA